MSQIIEKYHAAVVDCIILEDEFDSFVLMGDLDSAGGCLPELCDIVTKWVNNIVELRQVLLERGYTTLVPELDYYLSCFEDFTSSGVDRTEYLINLGETQ